MDWENYKCDGQMHLFDFIQKPITLDDVGTGTLFRYLRYGSHTVVPEVAEKCKKYLDSVNGIVPDDASGVYPFSKGWTTPPCPNCEHFINGNCRVGAHTCHFEYDKYLVCDAFRQTIVAKPAYTVEEKPVCKFSGHSCNKENVWAVADTLDDKEKCPHVCCRQCNIKNCGARCNGAGY